MRAVPKRRTKVHGAAGLAGESHVQVIRAAHDLPRPRLRLDVVLRDAHDAEEDHRNQHLARPAHAEPCVSAATCHAWRTNTSNHQLHPSLTINRGHISVRCAALLSCIVVMRVLHAGSLSCNSPPRAVPASRRRPTTPADCASAAGSSCARLRRTGAAAMACAAAAGWTPQLVQPPTGPRRAAGHFACCARCAPSGAGICRSGVQL